VEVPAGTTWPLTSLSGEVLWRTQGTSILRPDGSVFVDFGPNSQIGRIGGTIDNAAALWVWSSRIDQSDLVNYISLIVNGRVERTFELPGLSLSVASLRGRTFVANVDFGLTTPAAGPQANVVGYVPALVDLEEGSIQPIAGLFAAPNSPSGRNHVVAVMHGPFARVVYTGSCLNIRAEPAADATVLDCAADSVLLRDTGETRLVGDVTWLRVTTPSGVEGWASTQYLER
jgi:hypothetical protein